MNKISPNSKPIYFPKALTKEELELENTLDSIFFGILEDLRDIWDIHTASNSLLTVLFFKRILALEEEGLLENIISIDTEDRQLISAPKISSNDTEALQGLRYALVHIARLNPLLENIFAPLLVALEKKEDLEQLGKVFQLLDKYDFSSNSYPINVFGHFFNNSLYRVAQLAGKKAGYWTTPKFINELLAILAAPKSNERIFNPAAGQGAVLLELQAIFPAIEIVAQEKDLNIWALCKMNLMLNGYYEAAVLHEHALISNSIPEEKLFDLAICNCPLSGQIDTRLVKNRPYISVPFDVGSNPELDSIPLFIQLMLHKLKPDGRLLVVVPQSFLFKDRASKKLREFLIRRDWLDTVITLAPGMLYATGLPAAVLIVQKNKAETRKNKVLFINASGLEVEKNSRMYKQLERTQLLKIAKVYHHYSFTDDLLFNENIAFESLEHIALNQFNLNAKRYAAPFIRKLERLNQLDQSKKLSLILKEESPWLWANKEDSTLLSLPFISLQDISSSFTDYSINLQDLQSFSEQHEAEGRLVKESVLIVNRKGKKLRVGYFDYQGNAVLVSKQLMIFEVDGTQVNIEYLVQQLLSDLFKEQWDLYKSDLEEPVLTEKEFAQLQIVLSTMTEQVASIHETKNQLLRKEEQKVELLRERLNLGKEKAQSQQYKIISSLHHELGNRLPAILTEFKNLRDFLKDKVSDQSTISFEEPIFPMLEGFEEEMQASDSLKDVLTRLESMLIHTIASVDNMGNIVMADKTKMNLKYTLLKDLLMEVANIYASEKAFTIEIEVEEDENGQEIPIATYLDVNQMTTMFCNLIENAKMHGFNKNKKHLICFRLGLSPDKQEVVIEYKNDGKAFDANFSFEDFIGFGKYASETGHSGIGGFLIQQIIENHDGMLIYRDSIDKRDPFKVQFELILPIKRKV